MPAEFARWTVTLAPETRLLLCCARSRLTRSAASRLTALQATDLDWDLVLDEAVRHGLIPLLYRHTPALHAPGAALDRLEREFAAVAQRSLALTDVLVDILTAMRAAGVGATPFKGPALAASVYGDVRLRQFDNLDILVHRADVAAADAVLVRRGYQPRPPARWTRSYVRGDAAVNLHWAIAPRAVGSCAGVAGLWVRRRPVALGDLRLPAPGPEDHLLLLAQHASQHVWSRIGWLSDVAELLERHPRLDHAAVRDEARRHGIERLLRLGLGLAQALVEAPLPREVAAWVRRDRALDALARHVCARRLRPAASPPGLLEATRFHLRSRERWADRARHAVRGAGSLLALPAYLAARATRSLRARPAPAVIPAFHRH
jgi:putative nucleotidyltransferase-like protein